MVAYRVCEGGGSGVREAGCLKMGHPLRSCACWGPRVEGKGWEGVISERWRSIKRHLSTPFLMGHEEQETGQSFGKAAGQGEGRVVFLLKEIVNGGKRWLEEGYDAFDLDTNLFNSGSCQIRCGKICVPFSLCLGRHSLPPS